MICENCGHIIEGRQVNISMSADEKAHFFCADCIKMFGTCHMCAHNKPCGFFNDPDPTPQFKMVARQIRQGNATFIEQKQVPNAERIKKFCLDGKCKCAIDDPEHPLCCRHGGHATCTNYCEKETHNFVQNFSMTKANEN